MSKITTGGSVIDTLTNFLDLLEGEIDVREQATFNITSVSNPHSQTSTHEGSASVLVQPSVFHVKMCGFCGSEHWSSECDKVTNPKERWDVAKKKASCFACLKPNHTTRSCRNKKPCKKCHKFHHISLCFNSQKNQNNSDKSDQKAVKSDNHQKALTVSSTISASQETELPKHLSNSCEANVTQPSATLFCSHKPFAVLPTAQAFALTSDKSRRVPIRLVLDSGSQNTYLCNRVAEQLEIQSSDEHTISVNSFMDSNRVLKTKKVDFLLSSLTGETVTPVSALLTPSICSPISSVNVASFPHLQNLQLADPFDRNISPTIDMLVGCDFFWNFVTGQIIHGEIGPSAISSKFGWLLLGPVNVSTPKENEENNANSISLLVNSNGCDDLNDMLSRFWSLESLGVQETGMANIQDNFLKNLTHSPTTSRYTVRLPWKQDVTDLDSHYSLCLSRVKTLIMRLRSCGLLEKYDEVFKHQLEQNIIERVPPCTSTQQLARVHYIPHTAVMRQSSTTPLRIVFDASAGNPSLNDFLSKGPVSAPDILAILLRFRMHEIAVVADVEKAFLMIEIEDVDRDAMRFLWISEIQNDKN